MNHPFKIALITGAIVAVVVAFSFAVKKAGTTSAASSNREPVIPTIQSTSAVETPDPFQISGIPRLVQIKTNLQNTTSGKITEYTVKSGDSLWSIAQLYNLKPETILWGNEWL